MVHNERHDKNSVKKRNRDAVMSVLLLVLFYTGVSSGCGVPSFNLTFYSQGTDIHYKLDHEALPDGRAWNVHVNRTTANSNGASVVILTKFTAPSAGNPEDCEVLPEARYYKIHTDAQRRNWRDALETCAQEGGHLLIINSEQELQAVVSVILKRGTSRWVHWVGFHDYFQEGDYVTIFNEKLNSTGFVKWAPGEPGGTPYQNCGYFYYTNSSHHGYADGDCAGRFRFICERNEPHPEYDEVLSSNVESNVTDTDDIATPEPEPSTVNSTSPEPEPTPQTDNTPTNESPFPKPQSKSPSVQTTPRPIEKPQPENEVLKPVLPSRVNIAPGYEFVPGFGHYKVHDVANRKSWHDAVATCEKEGSHLLIINSDHEAQVVNSLIEKRHTKGRLHWVGFHDFYKEGNYVTICDDPLRTWGFRRWYPGQPQSRTTLNCGYYVYLNSSMYGIADGDCSWPAPFICEDGSKEKKTPALPAIGYVKVAGLGYYSVHSERRNWHQAMQACAEEGSHLLIINSEREAKAITSLAGKGVHWVGFHDLFGEGRFVTIFNETLRSTGYNRWYPGNPNDVEWAEEDCGCFIYEKPTRKGLADLYCTYEGPFICEYEPFKCKKAR